MNITVVGTGYVGLSIACLLAQHNHVHALDVVQEKVDLICAGKSPIKDKEIEEFLASGTLDLTASLNVQNGANKAGTTLEATLKEGSGATLEATSELAPKSAYTQVDYIVIATPTNYDSDKDSFDTSSIESVLDEIQEQLAAANANAAAQPSATNVSATAAAQPSTSAATNSTNAAIAAASNTNAAAQPQHTPYIVIKSTVPVGYTQKIAEQYPTLNIIFSPEFLREGHALYDNLHPSRIVLGIPFHAQHLMQPAKTFAELLAQAAHDKTEEIPILLVGSTEAEAIKLFSNTYLAMRIAYFNELDTYAEQHKLNSAEIIKGMGYDKRIGAHYNNPSFGYGGYCLPKDSKQLLANFANVPQQIMGAVVEANRTRKDYIAARAIELAKQNKNAANNNGEHHTTEKAAGQDGEHFVSEQLNNGEHHGASALNNGEHQPIIGIYRLTMKKDSDNFRHSSVLGVMRRLEESGMEVLVYEPTYDEPKIYGDEVTHDLASFKERCDVILANRMSAELEDVKDKVYTRDLFQRD